MFEEQRLLGPTGRSIVLQTHRGRPIENEIALEPDERLIKKYNDLSKEHRFWWERKPPSGVYNCVGHVWASRRTAVYAPDIETKILRIFEDDGYRVVDWPGESLAPGDLATYWESARGHKGFWHVGIVSEIRQGLVGGSQPAPWILSKWDDASGEVLHYYKDCPFSPEIEAEFWTDRPLGRNGR